MEIQTMTQAPDDLESLLASLTAAEAAETSDPVVDAILEAKEAEDLAELEESKAALEPELDETLLADLEAATARAEVYEAQEVESTPAGASSAVSAPVKRQKNSSATAAPRAPRKNLADLDDDVFQLTNGVAADKAKVLASRPKQVKVAEKFDNLFLALAAGKEPSAYVVTAMKTLAKTNTITSADLVGAFKAQGLKDGTARSQTGQIMELFNVVGIALRSGQSLQSRLDSSVADRLLTIINAPAKA